MEAFGVIVPKDLWLRTMTGANRNGIVLPDLHVWNRLLSVAKSSLTSFSYQNTKIYPDLSHETNVLKKSHNKAGKLLTSTFRESFNNQSSSKVGETVLLVLITLGERGPSESDPVVLGNCLKALLAVGLEREARMLALEALLINGL